jgi:hypothetical protein
MQADTSSATGWFFQGRAGQTYTAMLWSRAAATARTFGVTLWFYDATGALVSSSSSTATDSTSGWTQATVTAVAPEGTFYVLMSYDVMAVASSEVHYADQAGLFVGTPSGWSLPTAAVSTDDREIDNGEGTMAAMTFASTDALQHVQDVAMAELGIVFMGRDGRFRFIDRTYLQDVVDYEGHTWGDEESGAEWIYSDIALAFDDRTLWNEAEVTRTGGTLQRGFNGASQGRFFRRSLARTNIPVATDAAAKDIADYMVGRYAEPGLRVTAMVLVPSMQPPQWNHVLEHEIGDPILARRRPVAGGLIEQRSQIEGISHAWDGQAGTWQVQWNLSARDALDFWLLEDADRGVLGVSTRLGI